MNILTEDRKYKFYEIVSTYYITPETYILFAELIKEINILQSDLLFPSIFVLLSYLWMLYDNPNTNNNFENKKYWTIFCKGCNQLFWYDLVNSTYDYKVIFEELITAISSELCSIERDIIPLVVRNEIIMLINRFYFYYSTVYDLDDYIKKIYIIDKNAENYDVFYNYI